MSLIFAEFATSLKSPKIDTAKNKPYYTSSLRVLEIAKIGLSENLTHLQSVIFAKFSRREKFPIYGSTPHPQTFTYDLDLWPWPPKSTGSSSWLTCLPSLMKMHMMFWHLSYSQDQSMTQEYTEPQQRYYIPSAMHCRGVINSLYWLDHKSEL